MPVSITFIQGILQEQAERMRRSTICKTLLNNLGTSQIQFPIRKIFIIVNSLRTSENLVRDVPNNLQNYYKCCNPSHSFCLSLYHLNQSRLKQKAFNCGLQAKTYQQYLVIGGISSKVKNIIIFKVLITTFYNRYDRQPHPCPVNLTRYDRQ